MKQIKHNAIYWIMSVILIVLISVFLLTNNIIFKDLSKNNELKGQKMIIPLLKLSSTAQFFEKNINGVDIKFFIIKDQLGNIKTAFDACDVCYGSKKGYSQEGEYMVCNNCGNRYHISGLGIQNKASGGCWPSYLKFEIEDENVIIKLSDLEKESYKFI